MTLPFRRRHNDHEASHDRARALIAIGFTQSIDPDDSSWLERHLAGCADCTADASAYAADRELLRGLRERPPEPPRDLWARTSAAIEQERAQRGRGGSTPRAPRGWRIGRLPVSVASGLIVVAVVIGASLAPRGIPPSPSTPPGSNVAVATPRAEATQIAVTADALAWIQIGPNGTYEFRRATLDSVCPDVRSECATIDTRSTTTLNLSEAPQSVIQSPNGSEIVVVTSAQSVGGAEVVVVPVPTAPASPAASPTVAPTTPVNPQTPTPTPPVTPSPSPTSPPPTPTSSVEPTGSAVPSGGHSIASGVIVVGDAEYSPDGLWLAFSARPADGSVGPDLYLWRVGDESAVAVTSDHRTFLAGWMGDQVLANTVVAAIPDPILAPALGPSTAPDLTVGASPGPVVPSASDGGPGPSSAPVEEHPIAIMLDPETRVTTFLAAHDMWHPTVDPTGRSVVYWAGTLIADGTGTGWVLRTGQLVIDGWNGTSLAPTGGAVPSPEAMPSGEAAKVPALGPAGHPVALTDGPVQAFDAWFDPSGLRLAVWIADPTDPSVGTLRLVVLDEETLQIDPTMDPLPGVPALRGVSINEGRLAWVTPPGQDGEGSHVHVLGWQGRSFGQGQSPQAAQLLVVR